MLQAFFSCLPHPGIVSVLITSYSADCPPEPDLLEHGSDLSGLMAVGNEPSHTGVTGMRRLDIEHTVSVAVCRERGAKVLEERLSASASQAAPGLGNQPDIETPAPTEETLDNRAK